MRGRKPANPKVRELAAATLKPGAGDDGSDGKVKRLYPPPPAWIGDPNAVAEWNRLIPELVRRHKYLHLFEAELARYCVSFGLYIDAAEQMRVVKGKRAGRLNAVKLSSKKVQMLNMHLVVMNKQNEIMRQLAGDLGLNPVAYQRIESLQLDMFAELPDGPGRQDEGGAAVTRFGGFRRDAASG